MALLSDLSSPMRWYCFTSWSVTPMNAWRQPAFGWNPWVTPQGPCVPTDGCCILSEGLIAQLIPGFQLCPECHCQLVVPVIAILNSRGVFACLCSWAAWQLVPTVLWADVCLFCRTSSLCDQQHPQTGSGILSKMWIHQTSVVSPCLHCTVCSHCIHDVFWPPLLLAGFQTPTAWVPHCTELLFVLCRSNVLLHHL